MGKNNTIKQNITQVILIVFSVVLGLYLSERIEERKKKKEAQELLSTIKAEVKDNILLLNEWVPYHREVRDNLDSLSKDAGFIEAFKKNKEVFYEKLMTKGTFMGRSPVSDAWDIAKSNPLIVNLDHEKLLILSRIYNQQKVTFEPGITMIKMLYSNDINDEKLVKSNLQTMSFHMLDLVGREQQLMSFYRTGVEVLGLKKKKDVEE